MLTILFWIVAAVAFFLIIIKKSFKVHKKGYVLITGASAGIGEHAAEYMAKHHDFVVLAGVRKEKDAEAIRNKKIPNLQPIIVDVNSHDSCVKCIQNVRHLMTETGLPFVALVNNAGVNRHLPIEFNPVEDAKDLFNTNFFGVMEMIQQCLPLIRESKGRIVNVSSVAGMISLPTAGVYSASKFAVEGLSDALRREVDHMGVSVSVIQPAFVKSNMHAATETSTEEQLKDPEVNASMRRLYEKFFGQFAKDKLDQLMSKAEGPIVVSKAIEEAITAIYPKTRYPVSNSNGVPSKVLSWVSWLGNDRVNDIIVENK